LQILAMHSSAGGDGSLREAADAFGARLVSLTADSSDVASLARRANSISVAVAGAEADRRWRESGFWLMPFVALGILLWFRRGWVLGGEA
jgi:Ca-activated chloride channel homolog